MGNVTPSRDPVFVEDDGWYFWDETWTERHGPYETETLARVGLDLYCQLLDSCTEES